MRRLAVAVLLGAGTVPASAQWVPPKLPCDVKPGHFRINSAVVDLKAAAENANQRTRMLAQAVDVLTRSIIGDKQAENPGAWYYLGRYYVEVKDAVGADSAFTRAQALAPQCAADIGGYRKSLAADLQGEGLRVGQEGKIDSAALLLGQAGRLDPSNPRPFFSLGQLYASRDNVDSAVVYLRKGATAAAGDNSLAAERKEALATIGRQRLRVSQGDPAVQRWARTRFSRDSLERGIANDSLVLSRIQSSAAARRARGGRLAPADQQTFTRDSTARAQALAQGQGARGTLAARVTGDSAAAQAPLTPAIEAMRDYLTAYPDELESASALASLYAQSGRAGEATATFDAVFGSSAEAGTLIDAGQRIVRAGLPQAGSAVLARGLEKLPYHRDGLFALVNAYRVLRDSSRMLPAAQKLAGVDPLNRDVIRLVAGAWELKGRADSARRYTALADSALVVDVMVASFGPDTSGYTLTAIATNSGATASAPLRLTFEFFDGHGAQQGSRSVEVPSIPAQGTRQFEVHVPGNDLRGWRYRPS